MKKVKRRRRRSRRYKRGIFQPKKCESVCRYRSGWELLYIMYLDASEDVSRFSYEKVKIPYVSNIKTKRIRNYYPDFLVEKCDGKLELIEIKPKNKLTKPINLKKFNAALNWCESKNIQFRVLTEDDLKQLQLL